MTPFEDLIKELGQVMEIDLIPDSHQSCLLTFPADNLSIQIDLDTDGNQILLGTQLGRLPPGSYREQMLFQAMRVNGGSLEPRGTLAYSEKNDTLILFQFLPLPFLNGEKLYTYLEAFRMDAVIWKEAIERGDIPTIQEDVRAESGSMFGLRP